ncbi:hypothetical protein AB4Z54_65445 [Streptomyces sp. MCAF7]
MTSAAVPPPTSAETTATAAISSADLEGRRRLRRALLPSPLPGQTVTPEGVVTGSWGACAGGAGGGAGAG